MTVMKYITSARIWALALCAVLATMNAGAAARIHYVINDHLGTPQMLLDQNQNVVWKAEYDEFGYAHILIEEIEFNPRFPGQYYDKETGLNYNYYRDYDPRLGRYVQSDPIGILRNYNDPQMKVAIGIGIPLISVGTDMQQLNHLYSYVLNNPIMLIDIFGLLDSCEIRKTKCRADCRRYPLTSGPCIVKCEAKYGALSDCQPEPPKPKEKEPEHVKPTDTNGGICSDGTPCTFEKWQKGECK